MKESLAWYPQPGIPHSSRGANYEGPIIDGWRDLGHCRFHRVNFDLDRYDRRMGAIPKLPQFNPATDE